MSEVRGEWLDCFELKKPHVATKVCRKASLNTQDSSSRHTKCHSCKVTTEIWSNNSYGFIRKTLPDLTSLSVFCDIGTVGSECGINDTMQGSNLPCTNSSGWCWWYKNQSNAADHVHPFITTVYPSSPPSSSVKDAIFSNWFLGF